MKWIVVDGIRINVEMIVAWYPSLDESTQTQIELVNCSIIYVERKPEEIDQLIREFG